MSGFEKTGLKEAWLKVQEILKNRIPHYERTLKEQIPYDSEKQYAIIRVSICTGEKVAGFKNYSDAHFTEVMLIRNADDEKRFKDIYGLDEIKREY